MSLLAQHIVFIMLISSPDIPASIENAVIAHYDPMLKGRVESYTIDIRRVPRIKIKDFTILGTRGDDNTEVPRGTRLCWVDIATNGQKRSLGITVKIETVEKCPIAINDIRSRTLINDELIEWRPVSTAGFGSTRIPDKEELYNLRTKVNIRAGTVLSMNRLSKVPAIDVGDYLDIVSRSNSVEIIAPGKALQDGFIDQKIRVENLSNGKRLQAKVVSNGRVILE